MYFCLTGRYPFPDGSAAEKMMAHQFKEPTPIRDLAPEVPQALVIIVERLMQKVPEKRFGSSAEVVEALRSLISADAQDKRPQPTRWNAQSPANAETPPMGGTPRSAMPTVTNMPPTANPGAGRGASPQGFESPRPARPAAQAAGALPALPTPSGLQRPGSKPRSVQGPAALPSREMLRDGLPAQPSASHHADGRIAAPGPDRIVPGGGADYDTSSGWEEKLTTIGIAIGGVVATIIAWWIAANFF
jgi:serine/threonine protein kinase